MLEVPLPEQRSVSKGVLMKVALINDPTSAFDKLRQQLK